MRIIHGDCLESLDKIDPESVDMVLTDLPYNVTRAKWDIAIPLDLLWPKLLRVIKPHCAMVFTASQPFTSMLVCSNLKHFRYEWIWEKSKASNFLNARRQPLKAHESIVVFSSGACRYYPQKTDGKPYSGDNRAGKQGSDSELFNHVVNPKKRSGSKDGKRFPRSVQYFRTAESEGKFHPTQKPVDLMEYLIKTYTHEGDTVLDCCAGSGTTGVAAQKLGRECILIEKEKKYLNAIYERIDI